MIRSLEVLQRDLIDLKTNADNMPNTDRGKVWSARILKILEALDKEDHVKHLKEFRASLIDLKAEGDNLREENRKEGYSAKFQTAIDSLDIYKKACTDYDPHLLDAEGD